MEASQQIHLQLLKNDTSKSTCWTSIKKMFSFSNNKKKVTFRKKEENEIFNYIHSLESSEQDSECIENIIC